MRTGTPEHRYFEPKADTPTNPLTPWTPSCWEISRERKEPGITTLRQREREKGSWCRHGICTENSVTGNVKTDLEPLLRARRVRGENPRPGLGWTPSPPQSACRLASLPSVPPTRFAGQGSRRERRDKKKSETGEKGKKQQHPSEVSHPDNPFRLCLPSHSKSSRCRYALLRCPFRSPAQRFF